MNRIITSALIGCLALSVAGCPLTPTQTTIELVNSGISPVEVTMYIGGSQYTAKDLLRLFGEEIERTVPAGATVRIPYQCDDLQAVFIDNAQVSFLGSGLGPEEESDLVRDGSDFGCGDTIRFTFSYTLLNLDIAISYPS